MPILVSRGLPFPGRSIILFVALGLVLLSPPHRVWATTVADVPLFYAVQSPPDGRGELDSVALWVTPDGRGAYLFITDKAWNSVEIHDAVSNTYVGRMGTSDSGVGQMARPNGIAVATGLPTPQGPRDLVLVAERDNDRISAWLLPFTAPVGSFGAGEISVPYGVTVHVANGVHEVWVTSTGYTPQRVQVYRLGWDPLTGITAQLDRWFEVPGNAVLESIVVDPVHERALVCDESTFDIMVYSLAGSLLTRFGAGIFAEEPEGLAIYDTGEGTGYIVVSDQKSVPMQFEVFDRRTYAHIGAFMGPTLNTDGLTLTQATLPNLPNGSLFAVHNDMTLHAYDWSDIAGAMSLCVNTCQTSYAPTDRAPTPMALLGCHPNPFNPTTTVTYRIGRRSRVTMSLFDLRGHRIRTLIDRDMAPGEYQRVIRGVDETGKELPNGVYFVVLRAADDVASTKIILVK
jgi:3-phytase